MVKRDNSTEDLAAIVDDFTARCAAGESLNVNEFIIQHPTFANDLHAILPAILALHAADPGASSLAATTAPVEGDLPEFIGDYRILREIGRGGMGIVYEAEQRSLGRRVALKVLPQQASRKQSAQSRFLREARAAARLHHTNIVPVFDVGIEEDTYYFAMQYIPGQSLDDVFVELQQLNSGLKHQVGQKDEPSEIAGLLVGATVGIGGQRQFHESVSGAGDSVGQNRIDKEILNSQMPELLGPAEPDAASLKLSEGEQRWTRKTEVLSDSAGFSETRSATQETTTLRQAVTTEGSSIMTVRRQYFDAIARLGLQAADAIQYAHDRGTIHRDIKPSNLILDPSGTLWVADFGLAKTEDDGLTRTGDLVGTIRYMSPERFRGVCDGRADVYGLGVTIYELITLRKAFESDDRIKLMDLIVNCDPVRPRVINPEIPRDLETIILKAMDRDVTRRYADAGQLAEDLRRYLEDEPIHARRPSLAERLRRWVRRNRTLAAMCGLVLFLLTGSSVFFAVAAGKFRTLAEEQQELVKDRDRTVTYAQWAEEEADVNRFKAERARAEAEQAAAAAHYAVLAGRRETSRLEFDRALRLMEKMQISEGLHWLLRSLRDSPTTSDPSDLAWQRMLRTNLAAWLPHCPAVLNAWNSPEGEVIQSAVFSRDGSIVFTASRSPGTIRIRAIRPETHEIVAERVLTGTALLNQSRPLRSKLKVVPQSDLLLLDLGRANETEVILLAEADLAIRGSVRVPHSGVLNSVSTDGRFVGCCDAKGALSLIRIGEPSLVTRRVDLLAKSDGRRITGLEILNDERLVVATAGNNGGAGDIRIVDLSDSLNPEIIFADDISSMTVSRDEQSLLFRDRHGEVFQTSLTDPNPTKTPIRITRNRWDVQFGADPRWCLFRSVEADLTQVFDVDTGEKRLPILQAAAHVDVSPDGTVILTSSAQTNTMRLLSVPRTQFDPTPDHRRAVVQAMRRYRARSLLDHDARTALLVDTEPTVAFADVAGGQIAGAPIEHPLQGVSTQVFSQDGKLLATATSGEGAYISAFVRLWDAKTGEPLSGWLPQDNWVHQMQFSPDSRHLAIGDYRGQVRYIDVSRPDEPVQPIPVGEIVSELNFTANGERLLVSTTAGQLIIFRVQEGVLTPERLVAGHEICSHSEYLVVGGNDNGKRTRETDGKFRGSTAVVFRMPDFDHPVATIQLDTTLETAAIEPNNKRVALAMSNGRIQMFDLATGTAVTGRWLRRESTPGVLEFSHDGSLLAVAYTDGVVEVIDVATLEPVGPRGSCVVQATTLQFTDDGKYLIAVAGDQILQIPIVEPLGISIDDIDILLRAHTGEVLHQNDTVENVPVGEWRSYCNQRSAIRPDAVDESGPIAMNLPSETEWRILVARDAAVRGQAAAALWHLSMLPEERLSDFPIRALRGSLLAQTGQVDAAAADYDWLLTESPEEGSRSREDRVLDEYHWQFARQLTAGRYETAAWYLERYKRQSSEAPVAYLLSGRLAMYQGNHSAAETAFRTAAELGLEPELLLNWTTAMAQKKDWRSAAASLTLLGKLKPSVQHYFLKHAVLGDWLSQLSTVNDSEGLSELMQIESSDNISWQYLRVLAAETGILEAEIEDDCHYVAQTANAELGRISELLPQIQAEDTPRRAAALRAANSLLWMAAMVSPQESPLARDIELKSRHWITLLQELPVQPSTRYAVLNTMGLVAYRAGRYDTARTLVEEGIQANNGQSGITDKLLLLMISRQVQPQLSEKIVAEDFVADELLDPSVTLHAELTESLEIRVLQAEARKLLSLPDTP